ncbi:hypothetical protein DAEQUDRAFT_732701 [Daedalea quercina L-15889]|uniref:Uncharacterized protein n=1 Tax=Daedalea quercina L-15889 TaxID=1314783 RepID=A0A165LGQ4_9APHY|nr:hypothetical protein DAEQUDRAFT_732701 [Daedalea quercina L-15889]
MAPCAVRGPEGQLSLAYADGGRTRASRRLDVMLRPDEQRTTSAPDVADEDGERRTGWPRLRPECGSVSREKSPYATNPAMGLPQNTRTPKSLSETSRKRALRASEPTGRGRNLSGADPNRVTVVRGKGSDPSCRGGGPFSGGARP